MSKIPPALQDELHKRAAAGSYDSIEELIQCALDALDREQDLELQLIEGVESSSDVELMSQEWKAIRQDGRDRISDNSSK